MLYAVRDVVMLCLLVERMCLLLSYVYVYLDQLKFCVVCVCVDGIGYAYVCECSVTYDECDVVQS